MAGVRFTRYAETDLLELWLNIAEENPVAADESLDVIQASVSILRSQPEMGRARPELADGLRSFRPVRHTSFSMCLATITCWLCVFCTMRGILTQITFHKQ